MSDVGKVETLEGKTLADIVLVLIVQRPKVGLLDEAVTGSFSCYPTMPPQLRDWLNNEWQNREASDQEPALRLILEDGRVGLIHIVRDRGDTVVFRFSGPLE